MWGPHLYLFAMAMMGVSTWYHPHTLLLWVRGGIDSEPPHTLSLGVKGGVDLGTPSYPFTRGKREVSIWYPPHTRSLGVREWYRFRTPSYPFARSKRVVPIWDPPYSFTMGKRGFECCALCVCILTNVSSL